MNPNITTAAAAALLVTLPSCGSSAPPRGRAAAAPVGPAAAAEAAPYRMSGAALMMTPDQVRSALEADGYRWKPDDHGTHLMPPFDVQVQERITGKAVAHPTDEPHIQPWTKGRETLRVTYGAFPDGPRAVWYHWETEDPSPSADEIQATLAKRYGAGWRLKLFLPPMWCSPMPCSDASAKLMAVGRQIDLTAPVALSGDHFDYERIEAAARARQGDKHGSF